MTDTEDLDERARAVDDAISRTQIVVSDEERDRLIRLLPRVRRLAAAIRIPGVPEAEAAVVFSAAVSPGSGRPRAEG